MTNLRCFMILRYSEPVVSLTPPPCFTHLYYFEGLAHYFCCLLYCFLSQSVEPAKRSVIFQSHQRKEATINYLNLVKSTTSMARCFFIATLKAFMLISL